MNDDVIGRVRALAEKWRYKGEFGTGPWQEGHGPDEEGYILDRCAAELRAALSPADDIDDDRSPFPCWDLGHAVAKRQGAWVCVDCEPVTEVVAVLDHEDARALRAFLRESS